LLLRYAAAAATSYAMPSHYADAAFRRFDMSLMLRCRYAMLSSFSFAAYVADAF